MSRFFSSPWKIFFVAVAVRVIVALGLNTYLAGQADRNYLIEGDASGYWELAHALADGEEFSLYTPPRQVMRMPGFPAVLAFSISALGDSRELARFWLVFLSSFAVFPAFWIARKHHSAEAGILAGFFIALTPIYVGLSSLVLSEALFSTCILFSLWAMSNWLGNENQAGSSFWGSPAFWGGIAGLWASAAIYIRPSWLLFPPLFIGTLFVFSQNFREKKVFGAILLLICMLLPLVPWGLRNQKVTGHFVMTTLWMGPSLYDGLHPEANGVSDMTFFEKDRVLDRMSEFEMNRYYKEKAIEFAKENPGRVIELGFIKLWRYWRPWPSADELPSLSLKVLVASCFLFLITTAAFGAFQMKQNRELLFLLTLPIVYFSALHMLFVSSLRYRIPAEFPLVVLAAIGIAQWMQARKKTSTENET